jgi:hypothetical protein
MPNISVYLKERDLERLKLKARIEKTPLSTIIRKAVEAYTVESDTAECRKRVLQTLTEEKPLTDWRELHTERTEADACRR